MPSPTDQKPLATLIDAENSSPAIVEGLLTEIANYGVASVKRIYGDWTSQQMNGWKSVLLEHAIQPIQQFRYTTGKNATDSALIIDAMDLLYTQRFDGFCLVSSDSDFTRLAMRIREEGLTVYGFGEHKTPKAFVSACDKFIYTEILQQKDEATPQAARRSPKDVKGDRRLLELVRNAVEACADEGGWAYLGSVGLHIAKQAPDFDPRNYGFKKLGEVIRASELVETDERSSAEGPGRSVYVRIARKR